VKKSETNVTKEKAAASKNKNSGPQIREFTVPGGLSIAIASPRSGCAFCASTGPSVIVFFGGLSLETTRGYFDSYIGFSNLGSRGCDVYLANETDVAGAASI